MYHQHSTSPDRCAAAVVAHTGSAGVTTVPTPRTRPPLRTQRRRSRAPSEDWVALADIADGMATDPDLDAALERLEVLAPIADAGAAEEAIRHGDVAALVEQGLSYDVALSLIEEQHGHGV